MMTLCDTGRQAAEAQCMYLDFDSQVQWRVALCIKDSQLDTKVNQFLGDICTASLNSLQGMQPCQCANTLLQSQDGVAPW